MERHFLGQVYQLLPDKIFVGPCPANTKIEVQERNLRAILTLSVEVFINLLSDDELGSLLPDYSPHLGRISGTNGLSPIIFRFPVDDFSVPDRAQMDLIQKQLNDSLLSGQSIYIHCRAGIGRSGTVAACFLKRRKQIYKVNVLEELRLLRQSCSLSRYCSPETEQQKQFVQDY